MYSIYSFCNMYDVRTTEDVEVAMIGYSFMHRVASSAQEKCKLTGISEENISRIIIALINWKELAKSFIETRRLVSDFAMLKVKMIKIPSHQ